MDFITGSNQSEEDYLEKLKCLYPKSYVCPVCENKFKNQTVRTGKARFQLTDADLMPFYKPILPFFYEVVLCQCCGYAAIEKVFDKITMNQAKAVTANVTSKFIARAYHELLTEDEAIERFNLALVSAIYTSNKSSMRAYICMKKGWIYKLKKDFENEIKMISFAYEAFSVAIQKEYLPILGIEELTLYYLLGEYSRRLELYDESLRWFSRVIGSRNATSRLKDMARTQADLTKEKISEN